MSSYHLDHLQYLETEAIHVMREVAGEFERPALLFSGGKDSICILRLAEKAFRPSDIPKPPVGHRFRIGPVPRDGVLNIRWYSSDDLMLQADSPGGDHSTCQVTSDDHFPCSCSSDSKLGSGWHRWPTDTNPGRKKVPDGTGTIRGRNIYRA